MNLSTSPIQTLLVILLTSLNISTSQAHIENICYGCTVYISKTRSRLYFQPIQLPPKEGSDLLQGHWVEQRYHGELTRLTSEAQSSIIVVMDVLSWYHSEHTWIELCTSSIIQVFSNLCLSHTCISWQGMSQIRLVFASFLNISFLLSYIPLVLIAIEVTLIRSKFNPKIIPCKVKLWIFALYSIYIEGYWNSSKYSIWLSKSCKK